jgi:hypothetical protein
MLQEHQSKSAVKKPHIEGISFAPFFSSKSRGFLRILAGIGGFGVQKRLN